MRVHIRNYGPGPVDVVDAAGTATSMCEDASGTFTSPVTVRGRTVEPSRGSPGDHTPRGGEARRRPSAGASMIPEGMRGTAEAGQTLAEVAEAMEGHRKSLMDDKLPHRKMIEVELADVVIRVADLAGALGLDLGGAIAEKMSYNAVRLDHKPEAHLAPGGKAY